MNPELYFMQTDDTDLGKSFEKLINQTFIKYYGCLIERVEGGYMRHGVVYPTLEEAKKSIDDSLETWGKTVSR